MKKGKITDWLIKSNVIQAEDRDLYDYACRSLVFLFAPFVIALVVGMVFVKSRVKCELIKKI